MCALQKRDAGRTDLVVRMMGFSFVEITGNAVAKETAHVAVKWKWGVKSF